MEVPCLVFAKPPRAGFVKTRLIPALGAEGAARVAAALLADTWQNVGGTDGLRPILATPSPGADHGIDAQEIWDQGDGDLGARLERTLARALTGSRAAIAIGADCPGITPEQWREVLTGLAKADAVLGPTDDGGFWVLGAVRCPPGLLAGLPWSAPTTCAATSDQLHRYGLSVGRVSGAFDLDEPADLPRWQRSVPRALAPRTHEALEALGWKS